MHTKTETTNNTQNTPNVKIYKDVTFLTLTLLILFSIAIAAAMTLPSQRALVSKGSLVSAKLNKKIQHKSAGKILKIHVEEGEKVGLGQILVSLSDQENEARERLTRSQALSIALEVERSKALLTGEPLNVSGIPLDHWQDVDDIEAKDRLGKFEQEFQDAMAAHSARLSAFDQRRENAETRILHINNSKRNRTSLLDNQKEKVAAAQGLVDRGFLPKSKLQERISTLLVIQGDIASFDEQLGIQESAMKQAIKERDAYETDRTMNLNRKLRETEASYTSILENLRLNETRTNDLQILSPGAGTVNDLRLTHIGQSIAAGETLLTLVPTGQVPKIEALFASKDRDRINVGQEVRLDFTTLGSSNDQISYPGKITRISADLSDKFERQGYSVEVSFLKINDVDLSSMYPGIPVNVITTLEGETVLSQLIAPIRNARTLVFVE